MYRFNMTEYYLIINTFSKNINGLIICNPADITTPPSTQDKNIFKQINKWGQIK